ncbi:MAG TPA: hypothetical protein VIV58_30115 [Kofleriaceae bacterium]
MQRILLVLLVACNSTHSQPTGPLPDAAADAAAVACGGFAEAACSGNAACYALYSTSNEAGQIGGTFESCANGPATCRLTVGSAGGGGCDYGGVGCPSGFTVAFSETDGDCTKGFSIVGCVRTSACP